MGLAIRKTGTMGMGAASLVSRENELVCRGPVWG